MRWKYKGEWFESIPVDWIEVFDYPLPIYNYLDSKYQTVYSGDDILVYIPKHDKCYTIWRFGIMGNGNNLKMCLLDIYTGRNIYVMAKNVELVIKYERK